MIPAFQETFNQIGLSKNEQVIFVTLLQYPGTRVTQLSKKAHLNRTTTYGVLQALTKRGLISSVDRAGVLEFHAIELTSLINYLERHQRELSKCVHQIKEVLPLIESMRSKKHAHPKIQFFEGKDGVKQAYEDTLENNKEKVLYDLTGTDAVYTLMGEDWVHYYTHKRKRLGIRCIDITPDTAWSRKSQSLDKGVLRTTKFLPKEYNFETEIDLYDNKVAIFSFSEDTPLAVLIEDQKISQTMKQLFLFIDSILITNKATS